VDKSFELNARSFNDGQIVIYQRPDHKKPRWQCRLHIPERTGYVVMSTKTTDEYNARKFAEQKWDELRIRHLANEPVKSKKVSVAVRQYLEVYKQTATNERRFREMQLTLGSYFTDFCGHLMLSEVTSGTINQFSEWRLTNAHPNKRKTPSANYLRKDIGAVRRFHNWCADRSWCKPILEWKLPRTTANRRPHFSREEYAQLLRFLTKWVNEGKTKEGGNRYRERLMLRSYILILTNTGLRVGEARTLRWMDVSQQTRGTTEKKIVDTILSVKGKTGRRDVIAAQDTVKNELLKLWEMRVKEINGHLQPEAINVRKLKTADPKEPVFAHRNGKPIGSFKKGFEALLKANHLLKSPDNETRTIYSLRHTYATFRLDEGMSINDLRINMGTSTKMIETHYYHVIARRRAAEMRAMKSHLRETPVSSDELPWMK
jgi:integrase